MKRFLILAIVAALSLAVAPRAFAIRPFKVQFEKRYVKKDSVDPKDVAFKELVQKAGCAVCHVGEERKNRNGYGGALDPLLDHEADKDDAAKIRAALEKAEGLKSDPKDPNSPTFGELIKQGKLPAGE